MPAYLSICQSVRLSVREETYFVRPKFFIGICNCPRLMGCYEFLAVGRNFVRWWPGVLGGGTVFQVGFKALAIPR